MRGHFHALGCDAKAPGICSPRVSIFEFRVWNIDSMPSSANAGERYDAPHSAGTNFDFRISALSRFAS